MRLKRGGTVPPQKPEEKSTYLQIVEGYDGTHILWSRKFESREREREREKKKKG